MFMKKRLFLSAVLVFALVSCDNSINLSSQNSSSSKDDSSLSSSVSNDSSSTTSYSKPAKATIFSINDLHGSIDKDSDLKEPGVARLKKAIESDSDYDPDSSIIVSAGDSWQGGYLSFQEKTITDKVLGYLGVKAMTIGNHEWDWGVDTIKTLASSSPFPFLACNIIDESTNKPISWASPSYSYATNSGVKFGLIGAIGPGEESDILSTYVKGYTFSSSLSYIDTELAKLKKDGCDLIYLVVHDGVSNTNGYVTSLGNHYSYADGISGIIGGHTHTSDRQMVNSLPYVQAGCNSKYYSKITSYLDSKKVNNYGTVSAESYLDVQDSELDQNIISAINTANTTYQANESMNVDFDYTFRRYYELNKWVPDSMIFNAKSYGWGKASGGNEIMAVHNLGGIRANIPAGYATRKKLFKTNPFNNTIVVIKDVSGSSIRKWIGQDDSSKSNTTKYDCYDTETGAFSTSNTYDLITINFLSLSDYFSISGTQYPLKQTDNKEVTMPDAIINYVTNSGIKTFKKAEYSVY